MFSLLDHCMVNFIKENLLGSIKEFRNRFINPIQNGQCADSTMVDVRVMKKRAHILYEMLAGCVQVRITLHSSKILLLHHIATPECFLNINLLVFSLPFFQYIILQLNILALSSSLYNVKLEKGSPIENFRT